MSIQLFLDEGVAAFMHGYVLLQVKPKTYTFIVFFHGIYAERV